MRQVLVVGARPNFMKAAPLHRALVAKGADVVLVHTGQHFDREMSAAFFDVLGLPQPDAFLGAGGGSRVEQCAGVVGKLGAYLPSVGPCRVVVVGDVTSTAAAAVAADALDVPVAHVEAGLRSFDERMPEERNRRVADCLANLLFASEPSGFQNLLREGRPPETIHLVGNVMIDTLRAFLPRAEARTPWAEFGFAPRGYAVATIHRPSNVDDPGALQAVAAILIRVARDLPVYFPVHPRTRMALARIGLSLGREGITLVPPADYLTFLGMVCGARLVLTDSGGLQEEATALGVPCLTLRDNTERPITLTDNGGTSVLVGHEVSKVAAHLAAILEGKFPAGGCPALWDGRAAERVAEILLDDESRLRTSPVSVQHATTASWENAS